MRTHGTLTKWNDDRGFGFITPAKRDGDLFVHISAFPRGGTRPCLNELISYEIEVGSDGKRRAVRVMRPGQRPIKRSAIALPSDRHSAPMLARAIKLVIIIGIGAFGYSEYMWQAPADRSPAEAGSVQQASSSPRYACDGRTMCRDMNSCDEARYFIRNCPGTQMDGDGDGVPCESQWCN